MITVSEFVQIHSVLAAAVERELGLPVIIPEAVKELLAQKDQFAAENISEAALSWITLLDLAVSPHLLRKHVKAQGDLKDLTIRAFLRFFISKERHLQTDRDKVDWIATYLFQLREERTGQKTGWPKAELDEILEGFEFPRVNDQTMVLLDELPMLLDEVQRYENFSQITHSRASQRGRAVKSRLGDSFFHPDVISPVVNYNLVFGNKFHTLLQETVRKVQKFAEYQPEGDAPDTQELLHTDYLSTDDAFRHLGELEKEAVPSQKAGIVAPVTSPSSAAASGGAQNLAAKGLQKQWQELGIDPSMQNRILQKRKSDLRTRLKNNPTIRSLPGAWAPLPLAEWEVIAISASIPETEDSFRAQFAGAISHALAIVWGIEEELLVYHEKKGTADLWKRHYDTLLYLLREGRTHHDYLGKLAAATEQKGLAEKAKQLLLTNEKLNSRLINVAAIF